MSAPFFVDRKVRTYANSPHAHNNVRGPYAPILCPGSKTANMQAFTREPVRFEEIPANMQAFSLFSLESGFFKGKNCIFAGISLTRRNIGKIPA